jgi:sigma-B regulation protein RsbU (phosphoserine phosphatase)
MTPANRDLSAPTDRLEQIQAVTDAALAHMDAEDLLDELLDRVREVLRADTAAVLLIDSAAKELVATAAKGIEDEVRQGSRIPVGRGFAGQIAAERRPVIIDNVDEANVLNPVLLRKGIRSLLGVPLVAGGTLLGVLHTGTLRPRKFTGADAELLQMAADRAALAIQSLLSDTERRTARELQRSLLPVSLPELPGIELAARYSVGEADVGGDWYDMFLLPSGELCAVMGDVAGHGLKAAGTMGRIRSTLRANAFESSDPAEALTKLNRQINHFEPDALATVVYAICHPRLEWVRISSAGHLPPVLVSPGKPATALDLPLDTPIGTDEEIPRHTITVSIPKGALLCLYTDGLVERRTDTSIDAGLDRLCDALFLGPPDRVCAVVMAELIGREPVADDVALLMVRRV